MTLPPELERAIWGRMVNGFTGTISMDVKEGEIVSFNVSEKTRIARETHASPVPTEGTTRNGRPHR